MFSLVQSVFSPITHSHSATDILQISHGKILEDDNVPVFLVTFSTQEVLMFRNMLSGEIAVGAPDKVEQCMYAAVITRVEGELDNELTAGWKIIEVRVVTF